MPAYVPFIVPDLPAAPWDIASTEHQAAVARWRTSARQAIRGDNPQSIPMQAWLQYQLRFWIAADLAEAWAGFGGLSAQLNLLDIVMNISITDSAAVALSYGHLVREFLAERARSRYEMTLGGSFFIDFLTVGNPATKLRATAVNPRAAPNLNPKTLRRNNRRSRRKTTDPTPLKIDIRGRENVPWRNRPRAPRSRSKRKARTSPRLAS